MGIENILNKGQKGVRNTALAGMIVAGATGCASINNTKYETTQGVQGIPVHSVGDYDSGKSLALPRYDLDGRNHMYFAPDNTSEHLNWMEDNRLDIRSAAECPQHYSLHNNKVVLFPDESYCVVDLCKQSTLTSTRTHNRGGNHGGGSSSDGPSGGDGPGPGGASGNGPGVSGGSNAGDGVQ